MAGSGRDLEQRVARVVGADQAAERRTGSVCTGTPKSDPPPPPLLLVIRCVPFAPVNCQRSPGPEQVVPVFVDCVLKPPNWKREPPSDVMPRMWASSAVTTVSMSQSPLPGSRPGHPGEGVVDVPGELRAVRRRGIDEPDVGLTVTFTSPPVGQPSPSKFRRRCPRSFGSAEFIVTVISRWLSPGADGRLRLAITCSQPSSAASTPARAASAFAPKIVSKPSPGPRFVQTMFSPVVCSIRFSGHTCSLSFTGCGRAGRERTTVLRNAHDCVVAHGGRTCPRPLQARRRRRSGQSRHDEEQRTESERNDTTANDAHENSLLLLKQPEPDDREVPASPPTAVNPIRTGHFYIEK